MSVQKYINILYAQGVSTHSVMSERHRCVYYTKYRNKQSW